MQGYIAYPPHIFQKTLFLFNDVEEDSFLYRGGSVALPDLFPHYILGERSDRRTRYHYYCPEEHFAHGGGGGGAWLWT